MVHVSFELFFFYMIDYNVTLYGIVVLFQMGIQS